MKGTGLSSLPKQHALLAENLYNVDCGSYTIEHPKEILSARQRPFHVSCLADIRVQNSPVDASHCRAKSEQIIQSGTSCLGKVKFLGIFDFSPFCFSSAVYRGVRVHSKTNVSPFIRKGMHPFRTAFTIGGRTARGLSSLQREDEEETLVLDEGETIL